jgi:elongation factor G
MDQTLNTGWQALPGTGAAPSGRSLIGRLTEGFARACQPIQSTMISTDTAGLVAGEVALVTRDGEVHAYGEMPNSDATGWYFVGYDNDLRREYNVQANVGAPQVAYRETISKAHTETYTHKKQSGGSGQYAEVKIVFEPLERNVGVQFENKVVGGSVPKEYIPAVEKGIRVQADTGVLAGFPTVDFKYTLVDGKYHDVDSSALAFEIAAKACFREGMKKASPVILEPIMDVEVTTPNDHVGDVVGDLNRRRGMIQNQESAGSTVMVRAHVPLKEMFGYISDLRSMTKGRASFTMQFHHYDPVPRNVAEESSARRA